jgi:Flp pilus assembly secretin CpaC
MVVGMLVSLAAMPAAVRAQGQPARPAPLPELVTLPIHSTRPLQMSKKQPIREVLNEKDSVLRVSKGSNERMVLVTGLSNGLSRLTFTAADGTIEVVDVIVQIDLDLLQKLLERVVPTAVVKPIAVGNAIILTGTVASAEDIDVIIGITKGFAGGGSNTPVVNAMGPRRP